MQFRRNSRRLDGFLLYDKPRGITSNGALQHLKLLFGAERAGHTGTLDPLASGLLLICFGHATKFAGEMLHASKTYRAELTLGVTTSTGDAEGEVLDKKPLLFALNELPRVLEGFIGESQQTPPMHSALKVSGVPLYRLARRGVEIARSPRAITVYSMHLENLSLPKVSIVVTCSKGTYVRVLAEDIGIALGCGAHLSGLKRIGIGIFQLSNAVSKQDLELLSSSERDRCMLESEQLLYRLPALVLAGELTSKFRHGQQIPILSTRVGEYRIYAANGEFLGTGHANDAGNVQPTRVISLT